MSDQKSPVSSFAEDRLKIIDYLRAHSIGPVGGLDETLREFPHKRYLMGTLYAENATSSEVLIEEVDEGGGGSDGDELADDPVSMANSWLPSSLGLSFFIAAESPIDCGVWAARYDAVRDGKKTVYHRVGIATEDSPIVARIAMPSGDSSARVRSSIDVFEGRARIDAFWRRIGGGCLVTVTLRNIQRQSDVSIIDPALCLHQVGIRCQPVAEQIREYPSTSFLSRDPEDAELRVLHRHAKVFAIGHGCAVKWKSAGSDGAEWVGTELLPLHEVPPIVASGAQSPVLRLSRLCDQSIPVETLKSELQSFVADYESWIADLPAKNADIAPSLQSVVDGMLRRLDQVATRMKKGIGILVTDPVALRAFRLANKAMLMQMRHAERDLAGQRRAANLVVRTKIPYSDLEYEWRPFQLAFQLLTVASVVDPNDEDRDVVDLIWFPTGGGKTEAYLAVAATEMFSRRLKYGEAGLGTAVITRYTLRLLATQQFQRAAALVCACEIIRKSDPKALGSTPITIGLWVGGSVTPNKYAEARARLDEVFEAPRPTNPFQLEQCPWCGTSILPEQRDEDPSAYGIRGTLSTFEFYCPSSSCEFHARLPIAVVDEELYTRPPTFLLATVDKFARLAWEERGGAFFGSKDVLPPSLIIQDEMHLLSGPLGTTMAVYEGAIDALMSYHGPRPKIVASTATIRRAAEQSLGIFSREVRLFPPPGLTASDSYFARLDESKPGRLYAGLMSQSHTPHTTVVHVASALLQAPKDLGFELDKLDAFWTLVAYHNSIRELGRTITLARDDVPARIKIIALDQSKRRDLGDDSVVELTGNVSGFELPSILERLKVQAEQPREISVLATTNMLSVGVDIPRLGLMLVNGQPKTTSEYIQATSRVGRAKVPGLVVALYVSTKPRDRSHYESFGPYHSALYRFIEPTSVTPFSPPSRERALHAALVVLVRHGVGLSSNDDAGRFRVDDPAIERVINSLESRVNLVDEKELAATSEQLACIAESWQKLAEETKADNRKLYYQATKPHTSLLKSFGESGGGWETLHSMRNVDRECSVTVIGEDH